MSPNCWAGRPGWPGFRTGARAPRSADSAGFQRGRAAILERDTIAFWECQLFEAFCVVRVRFQGTGNAPHRAGDDIPVNFEDIEVVREFATSKDGTKVPLNICARRASSSTDAIPRYCMAMAVWRQPVARFRFHPPRLV